MQRHRLELSHYETPATVAEAISMLSHFGERSRLIAGGTDLLLELERGDRPGVDTLIDVSRVAGLDYIVVTDESVRIGAAVTHNQVIGSDLVVEHGLPLAQACWEIGSPQLRNRATVVGNLVTASPANDTISALMALGADLVLIGASGERAVPLSDFYTGVRQSRLAPDEMVTEVRFALPPPTARGVFVKLGLRRAQAISVVHLACVLDLADGVVRSARVALGSVGPVVAVADAVSAALVGRELAEDVIEEAAQEAMKACRAIDDIRATSAYRVHATGVMLRRALRGLSQGRERERWPRRPVTLSGGRAPAPVSDQVIVNGRSVDIDVAVSKTLLDWLRDDAGPALGTRLTGTKEGCAEGECGACTVFLDGQAVMACLIPAPRARGSHITTTTGLAGDGELHPLQRTFVERGAVQCGFCTPGLVMAGAKLLEERPRPSAEDIRTALSGNLCRCTGYYKIIEAVAAAAEGSPA